MFTASSRLQPRCAHHFESPLARRPRYSLVKTFRSRSRSQKQPPRPSTPLHRQISLSTAIEAFARIITMPNPNVKRRRLQRESAAAERRTSSCGRIAPFPDSAAWHLAPVRSTEVRIWMRYPPPERPKPDPALRHRLHPVRAYCPIQS